MHSQFDILNSECPSTPSPPRLTGLRERLAAGTAGRESAAVAARGESATITLAASAAAALTAGSDAKGTGLLALLSAALTGHRARGAGPGTLLRRRRICAGTARSRGRTACRERRALLPFRAARSASTRAWRRSS